MATKSALMLLRKFHWPCCTIQLTALQVEHPKNVLHFTTTAFPGFPKEGALRSLWFSIIGPNECLQVRFSELFNVHLQSPV